VFAGGTVIIALLSLWVAGIPLVASLGYASAVAVLTAVLAAITLLPAILSLAGRHLFGAKLPAFLRPRARPGAATLWAAGRRPSPPTHWPAAWSPWPCSSP
jgi:RND superfamily putative drug exporter